MEFKEGIEYPWMCPCSCRIEYDVPCRHIGYVWSNIKVAGLGPDHVDSFWPQWALSGAYLEAYREAKIRFVYSRHNIEGTWYNKWHNYRKKL